MILSKLVPKKWKSKLRLRMGGRDFKFTLERLRNCGYDPQAVVDVGAFDTEWSAEVLKIFPAAKFYLFEPLPQFLSPGRRFAGTKHYFSPVALADFEGEATFKVEGANSALSDGKGGITVKVSTLDDELMAHSLPTNTLLKIDVQGFERKVIEGAKKVMPKFEVVVIEASLIKLCPIAMNVEETCLLLKELGFRLFDICTFWQRPVDGALWQTDLVFVRESSPYGKISLGY